MGSLRMRTAGWPALALAVFLLLPAEAAAGTVAVQNTSNTDAVLAFLYYDTAREYFYVTGWYTVPAGKSLYWEIGFDTEKHFYWTARAADGSSRRWPAKGDRLQAVVLRAMDEKFDTLRELPEARDAEFAVRPPDPDGSIRISLVN